MACWTVLKKSRLLYAQKLVIIHPIIGTIPMLPFSDYNSKKNWVNILLLFQCQILSSKEYL